MQVFHGLTVLDLSQGIAGPVAAAILARQGANVIKIEPPRGDWIRQVGASREGMSANAIAGNLGKRSLAVDAATPAGREVVLRLAKSADVVIENFRPGVMQKLGLDYAAIAALNPGAIYCSISGFGTSGPWVGKAATDSVLQAYTGMAALNAAPGGPPRRFGMYVPDNISALYAAQAIGAALYARATSAKGIGRHLQITLAESCAAFQTAPMVDAFLFSNPAAKRPAVAPSSEFQTADGWVVVACLDDAMFRRLAAALGHPEWSNDARYASNDARCAHVAEINRMVGEILSSDSAAAWLDKLEQADVLCSPINDYPALRDHPQMRHTQSFDEIEQAPYGMLSVPHLPASGRAIVPAPRVGEHSAVILIEAGYSAEEIDELISAGVVLAMQE